MELADYNIKFGYIKGKHNILADISSCYLKAKKLNIYKEPLENPEGQVVNNTQQFVTEVYTTSRDTMAIDMLHNEQSWTIYVKS